ncbi:DUF968 domain-containing protein, partial [Escherichia coli]|nr:DUF968 domain-containing protein [Escherichia coli]
MKAVITPFVQKELGVATFKVDQEVRKLVEAGRKFIMEPVPRELIEHMDDGLVVSEQTMATNEALQPFFNSDELFRRIGGIDSLVAWLRRKEGQCQAADRSWCDNHIVHAERDNSAVLLCWHHDNHYRMRGFNELKETLHNNRVNWILDVARQEMGLSDSHDLSIQELCWWAFMRNMMHLMPEEVCRISINKMKAAPQDSGPLKEADIRPYDDRATAYVQMMEERAAPMRAKVCPVDVDSDPGMAHFKIPKLQSLKLPEYMDFVASRPCCGCGAAGAGARITPYIVRHSRLCAHDIYAI